MTVANLRDVIAYICQRYPNKGELTKGRLTKIVYLVDWENALNRSNQLTPIKWTFDHYGPFVYDVFNVAQQHPEFTIAKSTNAFGARVDIIGLSDSDLETKSLTAADRLTIDSVINKVQPMAWSTFISYVYSTYPIETQPRYSDLDLVSLAKELKQKRRVERYKEWTL